mmetsp:Transcript_4041/g.8690  ORF Transcript_4041/g.8690 Transcript_4041/m.8690 type:complete len:200 (+) Transcript_4041:403-1002(+)
MACKVHIIVHECIHKRRVAIYILGVNISAKANQGVYHIAVSAIRSHMKQRVAILTSSSVHKIWFRLEHLHELLKVATAGQCHQSFRRGLIFFRLILLHRKCTDTRCHATVGSTSRVRFCSSRFCSSICSTFRSPPARSKVVHNLDISLASLRRICPTNRVPRFPFSSTNEIQHRRFIIWVAVADRSLLEPGVQRKLRLV